ASAPAEVSTFPYTTLFRSLGTFAVAYPHVRTLQAPVTFTHAESDWVELLTDTGAVGLGLALAATAALGLALRRRLRHADSRWARSEEHTSELQSPCNLVCR